MAIKDLTRVERHAFLCNGSSCSERGAAAATLALRDEIRTGGLHDRVHTTKTLCNGRCDDGPIVIVQPEGVWYKYVNEDTARVIARDHLGQGQIVDAHVLYRWGADDLDDRPPEVPADHLPGGR